MKRCIALATLVVLGASLAGCGDAADPGFKPSGVWHYSAGRDLRGSAYQRIWVQASNQLLLPARPGATAPVPFTPSLSLECNSGFWSGTLNLGNLHLFDIQAIGPSLGVAYRNDAGGAGVSNWRADTSFTSLESDKPTFITALRQGSAFTFVIDGADKQEVAIDFNVTGAGPTIADFERRCTKPSSTVWRLIDRLLS